ncbi:MAG: hypothetical protein DIZ78_09350 [endosymbiont of Escarpia spicata]|uniref:F5/8 type C domain-containing protein n=1 Tax=endosymbiont of Escarpia spicata TaxID=2200908 RepID=A0A370DN86_9GAMM|nr:MAG: hypothetical protein DIZ78_09350 [endosymbiont of Escarpia spicata]
MTPYLAYQNLFQDASTVTASSEATGYDGENAYDDRTYDFWKPSSTGTNTLTATFSANQSVNYFGVAAHDLADDDSSIKLEYSTDGTTWYDAVESWSPADNRVIFRVFDAIQADYWRVSVTSTGYPSMGVLSFGAVHVLPVGMRTGFKPPHLNRNSEYLNNVSEGGQFLGRSLLRSGNDGVIDLSFLKADWVQMAWPALAAVLETRPFFFCWDYDRHSINLLSYSEEIDNAAWIDIGTPVITPNADIAPDGTLTADTIKDDDAASSELVYQAASSFDVASAYTGLAYIKKDSTPRASRFAGLRLYFQGSTNENSYICLDTSTGEISDNGSLGSPVVSVSGEGDYWRVSITESSADQSNTAVYLRLYPSLGASASWVHSVAAIGSCAPWGLELKEGSTPGIYVKTTDGPASNEAETVFAWTDGKITNPSYSHSQYMTAVIPIRCIHGL